MNLLAVEFHTVSSQVADGG